MAVSRGLIISLGVSALSCTILFLYFRNKITSIEKKVDVMFDLIQNHESQQQKMSYSMPAQQYNQGPEQTMRESENDLIDVSEDDLSDGSREVSDDEEYYSDNEDSKISLDNTETIPLNYNDIKKIVVPLVSENITLEEKPMEDVTDSLDEIDDDDDEDEDEDENEEDLMDDAEDMIEKAGDVIEDLMEDIEDAKDDDEDEDDIEAAEEDLVRAEEELEDAEDYFDDEEYQKAYDMAVKAKMSAYEGIEELD